jgi:hypothetical protein
LQVLDGINTQLTRIADCSEEQRIIETRLEVTARTNAEVGQYDDIDDICPI